MAEARAITRADRDRYRTNPGAFFSEVLGWEAWARQVAIAADVFDALNGNGLKRIAVRSGNGVGKTALAARLMLAILRLYEDAVVVTTAPTTRQVNELLWREARGAFHNAKVSLGGRFYDGQPRWELSTERYAIGLSPDSTRPEKFQGFHAPRLVFLIDEASGVPQAHWDAIKGSALAGNTIIAAIGNPTRLYGEFFEAFHGKRDLWRTHAISAFDTPNFPPGKPGTIPQLVGPAAVEEARLDWGEGSPLWDVRILGKFPSAGSAQLIDLGWIEDAATVPAAGEDYSLGVDVARSGQDQTVLVLLKGNTVIDITPTRGQDTMKTAGQVGLMAEKFPGIAIAIDDGGVGGGVVDRLREQSIVVNAVQFGGAAAGRMGLARFKNKVSELYWVLARALQAHELRIPSNAKLTAQLSQLEWELESDKAIRVHKRGMEDKAPSPDLADALALAVEAKNRGARPAGGVFF